MLQEPIEIFSTSDDELYAVFFQDSYYLDKLAQKGEGTKTSFNVYAFFLGLFWFLYRKMYVEALIILAVLIATNLIKEQVLGYFDQSTSPAYNFCSSLIFGGVIGILANTLYLRKAERSVESAKTQFPDAMQQVAYLKKRGGTSYLFVLIGVAVVVCLIAAGYFYDSYQY